MKAREGVYPPHRRGARVLFHLVLSRVEHADCFIDLGPQMSQLVLELQTTALSRCSRSWGKAYTSREQKIYLRNGVLEAGRVEVRHPLLRHQRGCRQPRLHLQCASASHAAPLRRALTLILATSSSIVLRWLAARAPSLGCIPPRARPPSRVLGLAAYIGVAFAGGKRAGTFPAQLLASPRPAAGGTG